MKRIFKILFLSCLLSLFWIEKSNSGFFSSNLPEAKLDEIESLLKSGEKQAAKEKIDTFFTLDLWEGLFAPYRMNDGFRHSSKTLMKATLLIKEHLGEEYAMEMLTKYGERPDLIYNDLAVDLQEAKSAITGEYMAPEISSQFKNYFDNLIWYCRAHSTVLRKGGKSKIIQNVLEGNANKNDKAGFFVELAGDWIGKVNLPNNALLYSSCFNLTNEPKLGIWHLSKCNNLVPEMIEILNPYCVKDRSDNNECTASNVHLARKAAAYGEGFQKALLEYIEEINKFSKFKDGSEVVPTNLTALETDLDLYNLAKSLIKKHLPESNQEDGALTLLGIIGNDNAMDYFSDQYVLNLLSQKNESNSEAIMERVSKIIGNKDSMRQAIITGGKILNRNGFDGVTREAGSAGLHHYIGGMILGCELAGRDWDLASAQWAGFISGAAYETKDMISHFKERENTLQRKIAAAKRSNKPLTEEQVMAESLRLEASYLRNYKADTSAHLNGSSYGYEKCR